MSQTSRSHRQTGSVTRRQLLSAGGSLVAGAAVTLGGHSTLAAPLASAQGAAVQRANLATSSFQVEGDLLMWTFFDQVNIAAKQFMAKNPSVNMKVQVFPGDQYETKMRLALQNDQDAPDLFDTDLGYQGKYINGPFMEDLSAMGAADVIADYVPYVKAFTQDEKGTIRAIIDHTAPGGFWFRRDITKELLGTGDPKEVSLRVDSWDKIIDLGAKVATQSNGKVHLLDSYNAVISVERYHMNPWVDNGKLTIDPRWNDALDTMRNIRKNNVDAKLDAFSASWGAAWNNGSVLMFAWPSWAGFLVDPKKTGNNWGIAKAPKPYYGGGRFGSIYTKSANKQAGFEYLKFIASPEWQQYNLEQTLNMPALQSVYHQNMSTFKVPLFGDQLILETYYDIATAIPSRHSDQYGEAIGTMFTSAVADMIRDGQPNEKAIASLKEQVKSAYPELQVD